MKASYESTRSNRSMERRPRTPEERLLLGRVALAVTLQEAIDATG